MTDSPDFVYVGVFEADGKLRQVVHCHKQDAALQHQAWPGCDFALVPPGTNPREHEIDPATKKVRARRATAVEVAAQKRRDADHDTRDKVTGGFASLALGIERMYPSSPVDQTNMLQAAHVGGKLWASVAGDWSLLDHTAEQAKQVLSDFVKAKDAARAAKPA